MDKLTFQPSSDDVDRLVGTRHYWLTENFKNILYDQCDQMLK